MGKHWSKQVILYQGNVIINDPDVKYDEYHSQIVYTMLNYQNTQFEVNPIDQKYQS